VLDAPSRKRKSSHISAPSSVEYAEKNCSNECDEEADRPRSGAQASDRYEIRKARDAAAAPRRESSAFAPGYDRNQRFEQADLQNFLNEQRTLAAEKQKIKAQKIGANTAFTEEKMASNLEIFNPFGAKNNTIPAALDYSDAATDFQNPFEANDNKQSQTSVEDIFMQQNASFELGTDTVAGYAASNPTERNSFTAAVLSTNKSKKAVLDPFAHDCAANIFSFAAPQRQIVQQRRSLFYIPSEPVKKE
jgi:hypothetical protein